LRRIPVFEAALFHWNSLLKGADLVDDARLKDELRANKRNLGCVLDAVLEKDALGKLSRYESGLLKRLTEITSKLERRLDYRFKDVPGVAVGAVIDASAGFMPEFDPSKLPETI
jgi:hypothetical protein